jgi:glycosyltransferase involved in cell wall biosynthesis
VAGVVLKDTMKRAPQICVRKNIVHGQKNTYKVRSMISVTILTKNSSKYLHEVLEALTAFPEVVVYDTGSTDSTLAIAATFDNVTIKYGPFEGFGITHNQASAQAKYPWIFSVDSDEIVTSALSQEILALQLDPRCVYVVPRENVYRDKVIRGCGWWPDRQLRLYHRDHTAFSTDQVHEKIISKGMSECVLKAPLRHYSYLDTADFLGKMQLYSDLFAQQYAGKRTSSPLKACLHGFWAFFRSYFLKVGIQDGWEGLMISVYNGNTAFYKYLKLYEANCRKVALEHKIDF